MTKVKKKARKSKKARISEIQVGHNGSNDKYALYLKRVDGSQKLYYNRFEKLPKKIRAYLENRYVPSLSYNKLKNKYAITYQNTKVLYDYAKLPEWAQLMLGENYEELIKTYKLSSATAISATTGLWASLAYVYSELGQAMDHFLKQNPIFTVLYAIGLPIATLGSTLLAIGLKTHTEITPLMTMEEVDERVFKKKKTVAIKSYEEDGWNIEFIGGKPLQKSFKVVDGRTGSYYSTSVDTDGLEEKVLKKKKRS